MALVLGMNVRYDNEIFLDDLRVTVDKVVSHEQVNITVHGEFLEEQKVLNNTSYTQITQDVKMMLGISGDQKGFCRVMVEAPDKIHILRGVLKAEERQAQ